jgi:hypothetical protein
MQDIALHANGGGGRQCECERSAQLAARGGDMQIIGTKVMPPLRETVRFVHDGQTALYPRECSPKCATAKPFRCDEDGFVFRMRERVQPTSLFGSGQKSSLPNRALTT